MLQTPITAPFRADVVGSYLRPEYLHQARRQFEQGDIDANALKAIEDKAISELVEKQKAAGLKVITDGEFRRSWWHLDFMWGLNGVEKTTIDRGYVFAEVETRAESVQLTGKISGKNHPFIDHFKFLNQFSEAAILPRLTIPAPAQFLAELLRGKNKAVTESVYANIDELIEDIAKAYHSVMLDLSAAGCRNLQLDDCTWGMLTDQRLTSGAVEAQKEHAACDCGLSHEPISHTQKIADIAERYLTVNNAAIANAPKELTLTTHVCRGNYRSTWAASGGYAPIADYLFSRENVDAYYLEFDTHRAGDFSPLAKVSGNKKVVLGLISSKNPELEDAEAIVSRIQEAAQYIPLDRLYLSTQCGFASTEEGNNLTEVQQWEKIALVQKVAQHVWG
ncbi:5-methyltetrahydropteroyltriglutamate--homocysteine S-methyltransferase [Celerinatantimonas yamalensis]|uniref:5-methyltetrahydropteroyltriglutamate--homocysteine S-methyltransferase n=1 Tax=Celerinatantimonas yamalensis TaxID=559956 RepID=A0ABW9G6D3_9GAMM